MDSCRGRTTAIVKSHKSACYARNGIKVAFIWSASLSNRRKVEENNLHFIIRQAKHVAAEIAKRVNHEWNNKKSRRMRMRGEK